jgi:hypothetical protein
MMWLIAALAMFAAPMAQAQAGLDPAAFTSDMAKRFGDATGQEVKITGPLQLELRNPRGDLIKLPIAPILETCVRDGPEACERMKSGGVAQVVAVMGGPAAITPDSLRLIVRGGATCTDYANSHRPRSTAIQREIGPGLCARLISRHGPQMALLDTRHIPDLKLSEDDAWELARKQTLAELPSVATVKLDDGNTQLSRNGAGGILLDREGWTTLAAATGAEILVIVPDDGEVAIRRRDRAPDLGSFADMARTMHAGATVPVSPRVFRWTENGWALAQ